MYRLMGLSNEIKISLLFPVLLLFIVVASMAGMTYAWFFEDATNLPATQFTTGTVKVDLDEGYSGNNPEINDDNGCKLYTWHLKNMGTKSSYARIWLDSDEVAGTGDTAWAYLENSATPNNEVPNNPSKAWGWTNKIENEGLTELILYAGAGGNDLDKGTPVGTVEVDFSPADQVYGPDTNTVTVDYIIDSDSDYNIDEAHLWIGEAELPTGNNNMPTAAPGQFPHKNPDLEISSDQKSASFTLEDEDLVLPFYVAAHASDNSITEMVQPVKIGPGCEDNWFFYEGYYYYGNVDTNKVQQLEAEQEFTFCLLVCLPDENEYDFEIQIEAVQSTNNAIEAIGWPEEVW